MPKMHWPYQCLPPFRRNANQTRYNLAFSCETRNWFPATPLVKSEYGCPIYAWAFPLHPIAQISMVRVQWVLITLVAALGLGFALPVYSRAEMSSETQQLSDFDTNLFRLTILEGLVKKGHIDPPPPMGFQEKAESLFKHPSVAGCLAGGASAAAVIAPFLFQRLMLALGFGPGGIIAGSVATRLMAVYRGFVAKGSIMAVLQSVGAAWLRLPGVVTAGMTGVATSMVSCYLIFATLLTMGEHPEGLRELEKFVIVKSETACPWSEPPTVTFHVRRKLLNNHTALDAFTQAFNESQKWTTARRFDFSCAGDCRPLTKYMEETYRTGSVTTYYFHNCHRFDMDSVKQDSHDPSNL